MYLILHHNIMQTSLTSLSHTLAYMYRPTSSTELRQVVFTSDSQDGTHWTLTRWTSFKNDIEHDIHSAMRHDNLLPGTQLTVGNSISEQTLLSNEEGLRAHAFLELNPAVKGVVNRLGVQGRFDLRRWEWYYCR